MPVVDINTKKIHKACQNLVDSCFKFLHFYRSGTPLQKANSKKQFIKSIESAHEVLEGNGKLIKLKPPKKIISYRTPTKMVTIIDKDNLD